MHGPDSILSSYCELVLKQDNGSCEFTSESS